MKNHIKNYIKIMGLAAVPFGTAAQVHGKPIGYDISVKKEITKGVTRVIVGVKFFSESWVLKEDKTFVFKWTDLTLPCYLSCEVEDPDEWDSQKECRREMVKKQNMLLSCKGGSLCEGDVYILPISSERFPFEFEEKDCVYTMLSCKLFFNPKPGEGQEEMLLVVEDFTTGPVFFMRVWSDDIPVLPQGKSGFTTNNLCPLDRVPLFISSDESFAESLEKAEVHLRNSVRTITDKEMTEYAKRFGALVVTEGDRIIGVKTRKIDFIGQQELEKENSRCFKVSDVFPSSWMKNGGVCLGNMSESVVLALTLIKVHNDTDSALYFKNALPFLIEPKSVAHVLIFSECTISPYDFQKAGNCWKDRVWFECPDCKSPKAYVFFEKEEVSDEKMQQSMPKLPALNVNTGGKENVEVLRKKDSKDCIKIFPTLGKSANAFNKKEIKIKKIEIKDKKEEPKAKVKVKKLILRKDLNLKKKETEKSKIKDRFENEDEKDPFEA